MRERIADLLRQLIDEVDYVDDMDDLIYHYADRLLALYRATS